MDKAMIARNARKHYSMKGGVPVWNPSLARFYVLGRFLGALAFWVALPSDWRRVSKAGRRPNSCKATRQAGSYFARIVYFHRVLQ